MGRRQLHLETTLGIIVKYLNSSMMQNILRPANFPEGTPGKGLIFVNCNGTEVAVINLQGRTFLPQLIVHSVKWMN